jgi:hypothetical protein
MRSFKCTTVYIKLNQNGCGVWSDIHQNIHQNIHHNGKLVFAASDLKELNVMFTPHGGQKLPGGLSYKHALVVMYIERYDTTYDISALPGDRGRKITPLDPSFTLGGLTAPTRANEAQIS